MPLKNYVIQEQFFIFIELGSGKARFGTHLFLKITKR